MGGFNDLSRDLAGAWAQGGAQGNRQALQMDTFKQQKMLEQQMAIDLAKQRAQMQQDLQLNVLKQKSDIERKDREAEHKMFWDAYDKMRPVPEPYQHAGEQLPQPTQTPGTPSFNQEYPEAEKKVAPQPGAMGQGGVLQVLPQFLGGKYGVKTKEVKPPTPITDKAANYQLVEKNGKTYRVNKLDPSDWQEIGGLPSDAIKENKQPFQWTEQTIAGVLSGAIPLPPNTTMDQVKGMRDELVGIRKDSTAGRRAGTIEAEGGLLPLLTKIIEGKAGATTKGQFEGSLDLPITPAEAILYRVPAGTTRRQLIAQNPQAITESDIDAGTQFSAAKSMLDEYRDISQRLLTATDAVTAVGQRARLSFGALVRSNEDAVRLKALQATVPLLVRALGEKGTLATMDIQRALNAVPDFGDTQQTAMAKIAQLEKFIAKVESNIKNLRPGIAPRVAPRPTQPTSQPKPSNLKGQRTSKPDGTYKLPSGETVTVKGGVIQ